MGRNIAFGYLKSFGNVSFVTSGGSTVIVPMECRLQSGQAAKVITLADGTAYNYNPQGFTPKGGVGVRYPVEQRLQVMIRSNGGGRAAVDSVLAGIDAMLGLENTLVVRSGIDRSCKAVLDEIVEESSMDKSDNAGISFGVFTLVFQQLTQWS